MKLYQILNRDCIGKRFKFKEYQNSNGYCEIIQKNGLITYCTTQSGKDHFNKLNEARSEFWLDSVLSDEVVEINSQKEFKFKCLCCGEELKIIKEVLKIKTGTQHTIVEREEKKIICSKCKVNHILNIDCSEDNFGYTLKVM